MDFFRQLWRLTAGCGGMGLCVLLGWGGVLTAAEKAGEVSGGEDSAVYLITAVMFSAALAAGIAALASWITQTLRSVLGAWLCVAAWGAPPPGPFWQNLAAHAVFTAASVVLGGVVYGAGISAASHAWTLEGLLLIGAGVVAGFLGSLPWALGALGLSSGSGDALLEAAAVEQGGALLAAASTGLGLALGLAAVLA